MELGLEPVLPVASVVLGIVYSEPKTELGSEPVLQVTWGGLDDDSVCTKTMKAATGGQQ